MNDPKTDGEQQQPVVDMTPGNRTEAERITENPPRATKSNQYADCDHELWPQRVTAAATALLVIITAVYTCYASRQATSAQNQIALQQAQIDMVREDRRPWVSIVSVTVAESESNATGLIYFTNTGRTPARNIRVQLPPLSVMVDRDQMPPNVATNTPSTPIPDIGPNGNALIVIPAVAIPKGSDRSVYATVKVTYDDSMRCTHTVEVCRAGKIGTTLSQCERNDEPETNQNCH